ncbi:MULTISPECIES: methionine synthase [Archaeoglobus]|uniref:5-methyltetrahydropteroyltriglutamate-homocysteine methyltransferase (MetE) n=2 Tax=Archaeoglobus fulgidus TaxID=2234 RepID=O28168_ARCFU|nr:MULTISPECIES: methionine synthase [Archaeoglobus]AAB89137.1 5-methyltetrahydropteroyltriglutamate-homocysteine methyltransferase (metE) [Archaeoglobus fulgidus DSM 4304]AIG99097.1 Methionine synthase II (cobalamin-independent) [Archaeoglobus fulgidus DSM 8774]MDI3498140.1 5-methyltetrahydropteroyltriglutamate--homocysteine methyltransferase [Archaeoglobus sp.]
MMLDDIGSFPLPKGITREWVERNLHTKEYEEMVQRAFLMKAKVLDVPTYPQFRDMIEMFMQPIKANQVEPYLIDERKAVIPELEYVEKMSVEAVRVCITGPFELYYREFGGVIYEDILLNLAESVRRFVENAAKHENVVCISIDEPSLGIAPDLQPDEELLQKALDYKVKQDVQIHLHEPLYYEKILETSVDVIGIECAKKPENMDFIDAEAVASAEKKLRIGVARSDIDGIIAEFNALHGVNAWGNEELISLAIDEIEPVEKIAERISKAKERFGDLLAYIGPDCGLFSFPSQELALQLLENVRKAVREG